MAPGEAALSAPYLVKISLEQFWLSCLADLALLLCLPPQAHSIPTVAGLTAPEPWDGSHPRAPVRAQHSSKTGCSPSGSEVCPPAPHWGGATDPCPYPFLTESRHSQPSKNPQGQGGGKRKKKKKKPDPSAKTQAEMFLCLGKCQRKKFPLRLGLCLQDFKPLIWTITAPVSGNCSREVPAEPEE